MIFVIILWIIGIVFCSFLFLLFLGFLCDKYDKRKLKRAEEEKAELIRICTEPDVDKMISLLENGLDPNTKVKRTHEVYASDDDYDFHPDIETVYEPLIEVAKYNKPIQDLLVAYGAKVLILVLVEHAQRDPQRTFWQIYNRSVLILILMEHAQREHFL